MAVTIKKTSRLNFADLVSLDGFEFWDRPRLPDLPQSRDDEIYTVKQEDRIDLVSRNRYRTDEWDWAICHANDLRLLPNDLYPNRRIRLPAFRTIRDKLQK